MTSCHNMKDIKALASNTKKMHKSLMCVKFHFQVNDLNGKNNSQELFNIQSGINNTNTILINVTTSCCRPLKMLMFMLLVTRNSRVRDLYRRNHTTGINS